MATFVHFIDTSIMCNLLEIPNKDQDSATVKKEFVGLCRDMRNKLILPYAAILETGNHIAKIDDEKIRSEKASLFKEFIIKACNDESPWNFSRFEVTKGALLALAEDFSYKVKKSIGICDLSIVQAYEMYINQIPFDGKIRIWTLDRHMIQYNKEIKKPSKRELKKQRNANMQDYN